MITTLGDKHALAVVPLLVICYAKKEVIDIFVEVSQVVLVSTRSTLTTLVTLVLILLYL